jgi:hypothetical protein
MWQVLECDDIHVAPNWIMVAQDSYVPITTEHIEAVVQQQN